MISDTSSFPDILVPCGDHSPLLQKLKWCHITQCLVGSYCIIYPFPFKAEGQYESLQQPGLKAPKELEEVHQTIVLSLVPVLRSLLDEIEKLANEIGWDTNLPGHTEPCQTGGQQLYGKCFRKESSSINPDYTRATLSHYQLSSFPLSIPKFLKIWTKGIAKGSPFFGRM